ncbi:hypothetical protein L7F22_017289 [Adiantum nelumboides]|nr:hypothetical protein [Adiantum nelumboides]
MHGLIEHGSIGLTYASTENERCNADGEFEEGFGNIRKWIEIFDSVGRVWENIRPGGIVRPIKLLPDVGDVLGDESLKERFSVRTGGFYVEVADEGGDGEDDVETPKGRVLYYVEKRRAGEEAWMDLSPTPTHLIFNRESMIFIEGVDWREVHEKSLRYWLSTSVQYLEILHFRGAQRLCTLLDSLSPASPLRTVALGIPLMRDANSDNDPAQDCRILLQSLPVFKAGCHIQNLHLFLVSSREDQNISVVDELMQILAGWCTTSPQQNSCSLCVAVRVLHALGFDYGLDDVSPPSFFQLLQQAKVRIESLTVTLHSYSLENISSLCSFLAWEDCPLVLLDCQDRAVNIGDDLEMKVANALETNYQLWYLNFPFSSIAARSRAAGLLARNRLYRSIGLSRSQDRMKPQVARLFLCGHGEVGKTTLRRSLVKLNQRPGQVDSNAGSSRMISNCFKKSSSIRQELRTRGLEIHQLKFKQDRKLAVFDLGGQPDYHIFHHYFMTSTSQDLFIVECKYGPASPAHGADAMLVLPTLSLSESTGSDS